MNSHKKQSVALLLIFSLFLLTGCWDSKVITDLSLVIGVAVDRGEEAPEEEALDEEGGSYRKKDVMTMTWQIVIPKIAAAKGAHPAQKPYKNLSISGDTIHQITREASLETKPLFGQHQKMFVFGESLARTTNLQNVIDQFTRDNEMRESGYVLIAKGEAKETLETNGNNIPVDRLLDITKNEYRTTRIMPAMTLQKMIAKMSARSSFLLQTVVASKGEVKFAGAAVIKGGENKLIGFLTEEELEGLSWLKGESKGGIVKTQGERNQPVAIYEIESMKSRIVPKLDGDHISFHVIIESNGRISEDWRNRVDLSKDQSLKAVEKAAENQVSHLVGLTLKTMQKKYRVDVAGFGNELRIHYPKFWRKIRKNWDEQFSMVPVTFSVKLEIKDYGMRRRKIGVIW